MYFFNLSFLEFAGLLAATSGVVVTLYLLNRSRKKQVVPTLRFWRVAEQPVLAKHRKRIQQPWSLILQLVSLALLLLAIAQLRLGSLDQGARDHVVILDTSAWMGARGSKGTLLDDAKEQVRRYARALPPADRLMLVRADGLAAPATRMDTDRAAFDQAVAESRPGGAGLNVRQALQFASQIQKLHAQRRGEIVFAGAGRVSRDDVAGAALPVERLRVLSVESKERNIGLRSLSMRRSLSDPDLWEIFASIRNYSDAPATAPVALTFGGAVVAGDRLALAPRKDVEASFAFRTKAAGWLEARLMTDDALAEDNRVFVELPAQKPLPVSVYTDEADTLRPVLDSNKQVQATYLPASAYKPDAVKQGIVIFDRFVPPQPPQTGAIFIQPPAKGSPFRVVSETANTPIARWHSQHLLGAGLRAQELKLDSTAVFAKSNDDIAVAEVAAGPVVIARTGPRKMAAIGFHPGKSSLRFDLATPLLFANLLRWMEPEAFRRWELNAGSVGAVSVAVEGDADSERVKVLTENNAELPFTLSGKLLRFYSGAPGTVRVVSDDREQVYSLTLPEVGDAVWTPPATAERGVPAKSFGSYSRDLWQWLALLGAIGLAVEWILFGRSRPMLRRSPASGDSAPPLRRAS